MRYPKFLKDNGTIGIVAPSFGATIEPYITKTKHSIDILTQKGYRVAEGPNTYASEGIGKSNTPEKCAAEFMDFYTDPDKDILISCGGGETMCEDVPFVDWDKIKKADPKWFMGYSDNTNFTYMLLTECDTASIYGPNLSGYGTHHVEQNVMDAESIFTGKGFNGDSITLSGYPSFQLGPRENETDPLADLNLTEEKKLVFAGTMKKDAHFSGRLIGGCVDCLVTLLGTKHDKTAEFLERYKDDGFVWFLECCDLNPLSIRRAFWQMSEAGWFKYCKGFIIGRPMHFKEECMGMDQYNAVTGVLDKYNVPIIMDCDLGHLPPGIPVICGAMADVTADDNLHITMSLK